MRQSEEEILAEYGKRFQNTVDIMKAQSGPIIMKEHMMRLPEFQQADADR